MGCWVSIHRKINESDESPAPEHPSVADNHHQYQLPNRPPPNLTLLSNVRTLRSHLAMSPPPTPPSYPRRELAPPIPPPPSDRQEEILYHPIRLAPNHRFRRNQVAAVNQFDVPTPAAPDAWSSTAAARRGRTLTKSELMSRRERERGRGVRWDPLSEDFSAMSATKETKRSDTNDKVAVPRKVTFGELPGKMGVGGRAARRVARSRFGRWGPPERFGDGAVKGGNDVVLGNESDNANDLLSMEGFLFF